MKRVIIVHGIHTDDDAAWLKAFEAGFESEGWIADNYTYGYAWALTTRFRNPPRAKALAEMVRPGDIVLGHSNGGCLAWMAAELGAPIGGAILLNPALDSDRVMASHVPWVNLYANRFDEAVPLARLFRGHPWGAQGRDGLTVEDARYRTRFTDDAPDLPQIRGHSTILANETWLAQVIMDADARINEGLRRPQL